MACGPGKYKTSSGTNLCVSCEAASLCPSNSYRSGCGGDSEGLRRLRRLSCWCVSHRVRKGLAGTLCHVRTWLVQDQLRN